MQAKTHEIAYAHDALGSIADNYRNVEDTTKRIVACRDYIGRAAAAGELPELVSAVRTIASYWEGRMRNRKAYGQYVYNAEHSAAITTMVRCIPA